MLSNATEYCIRALVYIVSKRNSEPTPISDISKNLDISFHFLTKELQKLTQAGLLVSSRGPKGGLSLNRPANEITVYEIIKIIDGLDLFNECILGLSGCGTDKPCPMHDKWAVIKDKIGAEFKNNTIEDLANCDNCRL